MAYVQLSKTKLIILLGGVILLQSLSDHVEATVIHIQNTATANTSFVRLGDVAVIGETDPDTRRHLQNLKIAPLPANGRTARIDYATIRGRLEALGESLADIEFTGSSSVIVTAGPDAHQNAKNVRPKTIADWQVKQAEKMLAVKLSELFRQRVRETGQFSINVRLLPENVAAVLAGNPRSLDFRGGQPPWDAWQQITARFLDNQQKIYEIPVRFRMVKHPFILTTRFVLPRGHVVRKDDLTWRQVDPTTHASLASKAISDADLVVGRETLRTIRKDEPLLVEDLQEVPLVRPNDIVTVYSRRPGIKVKRQMKARKSGSHGDTITLVTLDGRESLIARVTGFHEAVAIGSDSKTIQPTGRSAVPTSPSLHQTPIVPGVIHPGARGVSASRTTRAPFVPDRVQIAPDNGQTRYQRVSNTTSVLNSSDSTFQNFNPHQQHSTRSLNATFYVPRSSERQRTMQQQFGQ